MIKTINAAIAKRREEDENDKGFTLIELLVVVLIIGILAAIAIPAFLSQREGAWKSAVESDLRNAALGVETELTEGTKLADIKLADLAGGTVGGYNKSADVDIKTFVPAAGQYIITAENKNKVGTVYTYSSATGKITTPNTTTAPTTP